METINPSDVGQLDFNTISFITLKNGNIIVIDGSVKAKNNSRKQKFNDDFTKQKRYKQQLSVSKHLTLFFKGKNEYNNNKNNFLIMKNDFNQISNPCKIVSFCYKGKSNNKMALKKIPNLAIDENIKYDSLFQNNTENYYKTNPINKKDIISNTKLESNINENNLNDIKESNNSSENSHPLSSRNNLNIKTEEMNEEEKLDNRIKRKSRNYLERLSLLFNERNKPLVNAVISLKIPSDVDKQVSATEKEFDMMVAQLKQKRSKYNINRPGNSIYQRYYDLYKDNNKEYKYLYLNRIKYYQEAENENKENEQQINSNEILNNKLENNLKINNTFYGSFINKVNNNQSMIGLTETNINNKTTNSFNGDKPKTARDNKSLNSRIRAGSCSLVCPSNIFKGKLDTDSLY